jgi:hypothetical protein
LLREARRERDNCLENILEDYYNYGRRLPPKYSDIMQIINVLMEQMKMNNRVKLNLFLSILAGDQILAGKLGSELASCSIRPSLRDCRSEQSPPVSA